MPIFLLWDLCTAYVIYELLLLQNAETVARRRSTKQVFLRFLQNLLENICAGNSFTINLQLY